MKAMRVLSNVAPWPILAALSLCLVGLVFIGSATQDDARFGEQQGRQALFLLCSLGIGFFLLLPHYVHVLRASWTFYALTLVALLGLPFFAPEKNGARRWYALPGFSVQPSEFAKLAVVLVLAAWLRYRPRTQTRKGFAIALLAAAVPAVLIARQPDLGSALVFGPVVLAMCYTAGVPLRRILAVLAVAAVVAAVGSSFLHTYQAERIGVWWKHWSWDEVALQHRAVQEVLRNKGYQPWQALIALGGGGLTGFGIGNGPQNRYDFLPYRSEDYVFAVVGEETGWFGCAVVLLLVAGLVAGLLWLAARTRERFGRLVCVGVAVWIGVQSLVHAAVCGWLVPSTGLPMPLVSYGGSSTLATVLAIAVCSNIGARREPILAADGFV